MLTERGQEFCSEQEVASIRESWNWKQQNTSLFKGTARDDGDAVTYMSFNGGMGVIQHVLGDHHLHDRASMSCLHIFMIGLGSTARQGLEMYVNIIG